MEDSRDWEAVYRLYFQLERAWSIPEAPPAVAHQFFRSIIHSQQTEAALLRELRALRLGPPQPDALVEAFFLQQRLYPPHRRPDGRHPDDPMEDVYAAALSMMTHGFWVEAPDRAQLYRGQRSIKFGKTYPTLFREGKDVQAQLTHLANNIPRIHACLPSVSEEQAVAVAQHYASELSTSTWLLDVTYDPRVALFFASDGGRTGDIGMVACLVRKEWETLSAAGTNRLGELLVIDVPGAMRIQNQRASFLNTSHPDLLDQYVSHTVWFRQVEGLRFEDPDADFPVTGERIYPAGDSLASALLSAAPAREGVLRIGPPSDAREPLGAAAYLEIALSWCTYAGVEIDAYREDTLRVVCDMHARLQESPDQYPAPDRSLMRLQDAVNLIMDAQRQNRFITPREALRWSLSRLPLPKQDQLTSVIAACGRARDLC